MQFVQASQAPTQNMLLLSRLGFLLIFVSSLLLGIWAVKDTIALRNILLIGGSLISIIFLYYYFRVMDIRNAGLNWLPLACIFITLVWVVLHYFFF